MSTRTNTYTTIPSNTKAIAGAEYETAEQKEEKVGNRTDAPSSSDFELAQAAGKGDMPAFEEL